MSNNRNRFIALLLGLSAVHCLWAGKEFTANPGESTVSNQLIVKLQSGANINSVLGLVVPTAIANLLSSHFNVYLLQLPPGIQTIVSKALAALPTVDYVEPNRVRQTKIATPNDPNYSAQWALTNIQALQAWNYLPDQYLTAATAGTNRVKVAVLDTGADCTHPDFKNLGGSSTDSALGGQFLFASSQALVATKVTNPTCAWQDDHGHGTHTAGIVAAATGNGTGVASVGYALQVIVYKVLDNTGSGSDSVIAQAIENATNAGAQVVSMSLGGAGYSQTLQNAIDYAWQHNTLVVSAAGNTGDNQLIYPGAANHALGVAATDSNNSPASFSTFGNWVKIAAPGVNILSTVPTYSNSLGALNYAYLSGTSMATPHVAAVAGLVYLANPNLSAAAVAQRLQRSAQTPNAGWNQNIGYGVLNAAGAVTGTPGSATKGSLTGQVVDPSSLPITGATVIANGQSFTTASDGLFRIPNLNPGTYSLTATAAGYPAVSMQAAVLAGADTMLSVQMGVTTGEFTGTVTASGTPVAGAVVEAVSGGLILATGVADSTGTYALYLPSGTYSLTASAAGYLNNTVAGQVLSAGQIKTLNLTVSRSGNISGVVKDANNVPVASAHIDISNSGFTAGATSDVNGNFSTLGLPAGTYTVTASASGFTNVSLAGINVSANVSTPVTLQFSTGYSTLLSGLIGYWNFDEASGTVAHDTSGSGYNGVVNGATWTTGKINFALKFNGSTNSVVTPAIALGNTFSVSAWVNPTAIPQGSYIRIAETSYATGFYLGTNSSGGAYKFIVNNNGAGTTGSCGFGYGCAEGGTVTSGWHLVTASYDGATARLYVDNTLVASDTFTAPSNTNLPLYIGQFFSGTGYGWNGVIDEVRLYNRALTAADVTALYNYTGGPQDTTPPSVPANVSALAVSTSQINVSWPASTDNVGVAGYRVYRNGSPAGTTATLSYPDTGLTPSTLYSYTVAAFDPAGNVSAQSTAATATTETPPAVTITTPIANTTVSNTITVTATATSNLAIADVQFQLDGVNLGPDLTTALYSISWDTTTASNGSHNLTAIAHDTAHNAGTSVVVPVMVSNVLTSPPTNGLIGYWNFDEGSGTVAHDTSGSGYNGAVNGAAWTAGKINGALKFNGTTNSVITPSITLRSTFSVSAWVNPTVLAQVSYVRIAETEYATGLYLGTNSSGTAYKVIVNGGSGTTGACGAAFGCAEGGTITSGWHLVTATYDGATARLYVDNSLAASDTFTAPANTSLPLYIGQYYTGSGYGWNGAIDEVRLYNRALTGSEVTTIYSYTGGPPDTTAPSVPANVSAVAVSGSQINISWSASTDNVGVAGYRVYRNGSQVGATATLFYPDTGLAASTLYSYAVAAFDAAGNVSAQSTAAAATTLTPDTTPPTVAITAPIPNAHVSDSIPLTATASDNVAVADVQFQLDGVNLGPDLTTAPYSILWDTTTAGNGSHNLTAIAHDTSHNAATSAVVPVTVGNTVVAPPTTGLIGYWSFDEATGTVAHDTSGSGYNGVINGAIWTTGKINTALKFNGSTNSVATPPIALGNTFSVSAWVNPTSLPQGGYVRIAETQYSTGFYLGTNVTGATYKFIVKNGSGATGSCGATLGCAEGGVVTSGWHLVTATYDGTTARLYVDNALAASDTFTAPSNTSLPLYIGQYFAGTGYGWNGAIDEVRLYSRVLTAAEVATIYNYTGGPPATPPAVAIAAPVANATVSNSIALTATASSNLGIADVQFQLDGVNLGTDLTTAPYSILWDTTTAINGSHNLTAIARDAAHNAATSAVVTVTVSNTVTSPPANGLIGYWNFDEDSGSIAHDTSGSGYNGVINGATWTAGKNNFALKFSGSTNSAVTPNILLGSTFSISAWVNPSLIPQGGYVRIAETEYSPGFYLGANVSGATYKFIVNGGSGATGSCGVSLGCAEGGVITAGWHLVTATYDGATARLYVDNALAASDTFTAPPNTNFPLYIGQYFGGSGYGWNGVIDEVRLYNRALSTAEVVTIFNYQ